MEYSLEGKWQVRLEDGTQAEMMLPGTLDENKIGYPDVGVNQWHPDAELGNGKEKIDIFAPIATRFTRKYTYEGEAAISRKITWVPPAGKRVFLEAERARCLKLLVDGCEIKDFLPPSISTPHIFEITGLLDGDNEITLLSDNSYPGLPHDDIVFSSAATDETQTNWNGVLGYVRLRTQEPVFLSDLAVYPRGRNITVQAEIAAAVPYKGVLTLSSLALKEDFSMEIQAGEGITRVKTEELMLDEKVLCWDELEGNLYTLKASLTGAEEKTAVFGVRDFSDNGRGRLALNNRTIFLRSEANCAEFPETGYCPMTVQKWRDILKVYASYGVNCVRFHSHCPPEAAFIAADEMGMMMQPELSHWNPKNALETEESYTYYQRELEQILRMLANHPSFVMLTLGNELWSGEKGHKRMSKMLHGARELDNTRLYANGSNVHYGTIGCDEDSDFYTSQKYCEDHLRGTFAVQKEDLEGKNQKHIPLVGYMNNQYPNAKTNYDAAMEKLRKTYKKPVFSFEVGQFEVLPDFRELEDFKGISDPVNYRLIQEKVKVLGLEELWEKYVEATGELSRISYREEIEAAMRTEELSGISLLGLQDFPGQGTALVGMLNAHLQPKPFPFAQPENFRKFFCDTLPLVLLEKYTYEVGETLRAEVILGNYGKKDRRERLQFRLQGENVLITGSLQQTYCPQGKNTSMGTIVILLENIEKAVRLDITVWAGEAVNSYPVWVYPKTEPVCPAGIYETEYLDKETERVLEEGGTVYLAPPATEEYLPMSAQGQFTTDFWSVGTFAAQEGCMGQLIDASHPVFKDFPTEFHTNWQWWPMASGRAVILPEPIESIITEMDSYAFMRPMSQLFECRCGRGRLLFSSLGLQALNKYPEARALQASIYRYLSSDEFAPKQRIDLKVIAALVKGE